VTSSRRPRSESQVASVVVEALSGLIRRVPTSPEPPAGDPKSRALRIAKVAARRASGVSTALSLPPGPLGMLTVLPDLLSVWRIQRQMVADIAAVYGQTATLTRETMLHCLFKHGGAALLRDLVVRAGERYVIRPASIHILQRSLAKVGVRVTHQVLGRTLSRYVPLIGALGVGAYAYYDTSQVAANAIELFSREVVVEPAV
jgi:hypothetical protein